MACRYKQEWSYKKRLATHWDAVILDELSNKDTLRLAYALSQSSGVACHVLDLSIGFLQRSKHKAR